MLGGLDVPVGELALEHVHLGGAHERTLALGDELDALARAVGALVELAGQELHREDAGVARLGHVGRGDVGLRLREDRGHAEREQLVVDALDVVAVDEAQAGDAGDAQQVAELALERLGLEVESGLLLDVDA